MSMMRPFSRFQHGSMNTLSSATPISDEELLKFAPAIFQEDKHRARSERYTHVPTAAIHREMVKTGFYPIKVVKATARAKENETTIETRAREAFKKHMILYRHPDALRPEGSPYFGQVGYVGDHDGRCSIQMFAGLLEVLCGNGLIAGKVAEAIRLSHVKLSVHDVIEAAIKMMNALGVVGEWRGELQNIPVNWGVQLAFAREAMKLRWEKGEEPILDHQLLEMRRIDDTTDNLWGLYNVVEENMRLGGMEPWAAHERLKAANREGRMGVRPTRVRQVNSLDGGLSLEVGLSNLAEEFRVSLAKAA
jgi:hypothetical protein